MCYNFDINFGYGSFIVEFCRNFDGSEKSFKLEILRGKFNGFIWIILCCFIWIILNDFLHNLQVKFIGNFMKFQD